MECWLAKTTELKMNATWNVHVENFLFQVCFHVGYLFLTPGRWYDKSDFSHLSIIEENADLDHYFFPDKKYVPCSHCVLKHRSRSSQRVSQPAALFYLSTCEAPSALAHSSLCSAKCCFEINIWEPPPLSFSLSLCRDDVIMVAVYCCLATGARWR